MEFVAPQFNPPADVLGAYLRGRMAPGVLQEQQQQLQQGADTNQYNQLKLQQMRMALQLGQRAMQSQQPQPEPVQPGMEGLQEQHPRAGAQEGYLPSDYNIPSAPVPQIDPALGTALSNLAGGESVYKTLLDSQKLKEEQQQAMVKTAQFKAAGPLQVFDSVASSPSPARMAMNNPSIMALWPRAAMQLGLDPVRDFNDENVRQAAIFGSNQIRVATQQAPRSFGYTQSKGPDGSIIQTDLATNKQDTVVGRQPATLFSAANMSPDDMNFAYDNWKASGKLPVSVSRSPKASAELLHQFRIRAEQLGDTGASIYAGQQERKAGGQALSANTKLLAATRGYAETLDKNLGNLITEYKKLGGAESPLVNRGIRAWQQGIAGDAQVAGVITWLNAVQGEYAKLKSGSLGVSGASVDSMRDAKEVINKNLNQGGIEAVAAAMRGEKENRLGSLTDENDRLKQMIGGDATASPSAESAADRAKRMGL